MADLSIFPYTECAQYSDGVFKRGVRSALELYLRIALGVKDELLRIPLETAADVNTTLHGHAMQSMRHMSDTWLNRGLETSAHLFETELAQYNDHFQEVRGGLAAMFFIAIVLLLVVVYDPLVRSLDDEFKKVRSILVIVPISWLEDTRVLADLVKAQATS
mgnify:CR=1 FL=1